MATCLLNLAFDVPRFGPPLAAKAPAADAKSTQVSRTPARQSFRERSLWVQETTHLEHHAKSSCDSMEPSALAVAKAEGDLRRGARRDLPFVSACCILVQLTAATFSSGSRGHAAENLL